MKSAYNHTGLLNLHIVKEANRWTKSELITAAQRQAIRAEYPVSFYHPNIFIRILLFIATFIALSGVTGMLVLIFGDAINNETAIYTLMLFYGLVSFAILDLMFIATQNHYKSGVTEALLYHAAGFTIGGAMGLTDFEVSTMAIIVLVVCGFAAFRYLDLIATVCAFCALAFFIFYRLYEAGGVVQQITPLVLIAVFTGVYFIVRKVSRNPETEVWEDVLLIVESLSLVLIYVAGNYFVVRELSMELMNLYLEPGDDIPFAWLFYGLTVLIPVGYLYFGLKKKDFALIRVSLIAIAFSVFTFKYYFSLGHPEITLTLAGAVLLTVSLLLFRYLRTPRHGYTRENLLDEKWANANLEGFIVSQSLGGNQVTTSDVETGGGGVSRGGGSTDSF